MGKFTMSSLTPKTYVMSLTAEEIERRLLSIDNFLLKTVIRQSLLSPATDTVPSTQCVVDALTPINTTLSSLGDLASKDSVALDSNETGGVLPLSKGGTGGTSLPTAQQNLGILTQSEIQNLINNSIPTVQSVDLGSNQVNGVLPVSKGGTGSNNPSTALKNLGIHDANGKVPVTQLPDVAVHETTTYTVSTQADMTSLNAVQGDFCIRLDTTQTFILKQVPASTFSNWQEILNDSYRRITPQVFQALKRVHAVYGKNLVAGSFELGASVTAANDVVVRETTGDTYSWAGTLPKTVTAGSDPSSDPLWVVVPVGESKQAALGFTNAIINGDMRIVQRSSKMPISVPHNSFEFGVDRFYLGNTAGASSNVVMSYRHVPGPNSEFPWAAQAYTVTTGAFASSGVCVFEQPIEGLNLAGFVGVPLVISFWVKSSVVGKYSVGLAANDSNPYSFITSVTVNAADTWEKKVVKIPQGVPASYVTAFDNACRLRLRITFAGNNQTPTADAWVAGNFFTVSGQAHMPTTAGNTFSWTGVQLAVGTEEKPFEHKPYGYELALCKRYYTKLGTGATSGAVGMYCVVTGGLAGSVYVGAPMRTTPSMIISLQGVPNRIRNAGNNIQTAITGVSFYAQDIAGSGLISGITATGPVAGGMYDFDLELSAEL